MFAENDHLRDALCIDEIGNDGMYNSKWRLVYKPMLFHRRVNSITEDIGICTAPQTVVLPWGVFPCV